MQLKYAQYQTMIYNCTFKCYPHRNPIMENIFLSSLILLSTQAVHDTTVQSILQYMCTHSCPNTAHQKFPCRSICVYLLVFRFDQQKDFKYKKIFFFKIFQTKNHSIKQVFKILLIFSISSAIVPLDYLCVNIDTRIFTKNDRTAV